MAAAISVLCWSTPDVANAAAIASLTRTQYLTGAPSVVEPPSCLSRNITLATGNYEWAHDYDGSWFPYRYIYLARGTYYWYTCLDPNDGYYEDNSYLIPPVGDTATLSSILNPTSDTHTWGDILIPQF